MHFEHIAEFSHSDAVYIILKHISENIIMHDGIDGQTTGAMLIIIASRIIHLCKSR